VKKIVAGAIFAPLLALAAALSGCSGDTVYREGTYTALSGEDDTGAYAEVTVTVDGEGRIADCRFITWQADGTVKDEDYGKVNGEISNRDFYDKAQLAVAAMQTYARQIVETQDLYRVDAISGATIAYDQFLEAAGKALAEAAR
jgi:major membrane immunogen (membrane-anchored lipoprotein)